MATITRSKRLVQLTAEDMASIFQSSQSGSLSSHCSSDESGSECSRFWESSDDDKLTSLSGYSSESDSKLLSDFPSDNEKDLLKVSIGKTQQTYSDNNVPSRQKRKIIPELV